MDFFIFFFLKSSTVCLKTVCQKVSIKDLSQGFQGREYLWDHSRQGRSPFPSLSIWYVGFVQHKKERKEKQCSLSSKNDCIKNVKAVFKTMLLTFYRCYLWSYQLCDCVIRKHTTLLMSSASIVFVKQKHAKDVFDCKLILWEISRNSAVRPTNVKIMLEYFFFFFC